MKSFIDAACAKEWIWITILSFLIEDCQFFIKGDTISARQ